MYLLIVDRMSHNNSDEVPVLCASLEKAIALAKERVDPDQDLPLVSDQLVYEITPTGLIFRGYIDMLSGEWVPTD